MSEQQPKPSARGIPFTEAFKEFIPSGWAPYATELPEPLPTAAWTAARRQQVSEQFPGDRLVIPAGGLKVRSNDTDYRYRPDSAFAHLSGLGSDREPDAVLVLEPTDSMSQGAGPGDGHQATLYFKPRAPREAEEFYADARYGEMWVGQRESLAEMAALTGISVADIADLDEALAKNLQGTRVRIVRDADQGLTERLDSLRDKESEQTAEEAQEADLALATALSELRLVKDSFEVEQLRQACAESAKAFEAVVRDLPEAVRRGRGERWVEGVFGLHARHAGNAVGYDTIAAAGNHACTLHWIRNDGDIRDDELLLMDAGVELDTLYTADITRTMPVGGRFTDAQREVYDAVLAAQQAGIDAAKPGAKFLDVHNASIAVIANYLHQWGILPVEVAETLNPETGGQHRRWMAHGTSHHLGIDVHDCAQARRETYREGTLLPGMVITVEPGIYFRENDLLVPERFRGIGVRIEDDILITEDGNENLSAMLPRGADEVEAWMGSLLGAR